MGTRAGYGGCSIGSATKLSTLLGSVPSKPAPLVGGKRTNPTPIPDVVAIIQGLRAKRPGVDMNALMRSEKLGIAEVGIWGRGACLVLCTLANSPERGAPTTTGQLVMCRQENAATALSE
jgi:hypothetical protein